MAWRVQLAESVIDDLAWFGRKTGRLLLKEAALQLEENPLLETRNMKALRPNPFAERELRLFGKFRLLFNVDPQAEIVTIVLAGEKRGDVLLAQGKEFTEHHESDPSQ